MSLATIFSNPAWRLSNAVAYPNQLGRLDHDGTTIGAVVVMRREGRGQDFALGVAGLRYILEAEQKGRISEGHVVLAHGLNGNNRPTFIASERAQVVDERLRDHAPWEGKLGPYWWITADFQPTASMSLEPNAPF